MSLFAKSKKMAGWMAINLQKGRIDVAHVSRPSSGLPVVELTASYSLQNSEPEQQLEKLGKELHAARYECSCLLAPDEYQLLLVEAPNVPRDELKTAIRWRLKDMLDFHVDDATVDVLDIPQDKNAPTRNHSMYAVAARNQIIQQRQALFEEARVPLAAIDIPDMAQRNLSTLLEPGGRGLAMLSFEEGSGLLTVSFGGELYLSRRIDVGIAQLRQPDPEQRTACYERITLELQRSLDHFDRQYHFIAVAKLVIASPDEEVAALLEYLSSNLYLPVEPLDLESILDLSKVPDLRRPLMQQQFLMTLGAALRHEEKVL